MTRLITLALASASIAAMASAAAAQNVATTPAAPAAAPAEEATLGEIVVTARRRSESLQNVPQSVAAVTADTLQKLNITQFTDIQTVVPGLSLSNSTNGYTASASMRGVTFDVNTAAPLGTVAMYMNDAPVQTSLLFNSQFDIGQVEVLRGPQGTTRGVSAPSGAMTATTHRPNLSESGGYANVTATDQHGRNAQGALNIPVINDVLAVRLAGVIDQNDAGGVRSIHSSAQPSAKTVAERLSVAFEPSDRLNANLMYQHLDNRFQTFDQVSGLGASDPSFPAGFRAAYAAINPPLSPFDRAAVEDGVSDARTHQDMVIANIDSRIFGQHLSYVGSYQHTKTHARNLGLVNNADVGNIVPGLEFFNYENVGQEQTTHELRLASDPAPGRFFDYTVGAFYNWSRAFGVVHSPDRFTLGAFGSPALAPNPAAYDPRYVLFNSYTNTGGANQETSLFGNVTLHLGDKTELSGGIRHIWSVVTKSPVFNAAPGLGALPPAFLPLLGFPGLGGGCGPLSNTYSGFCDVPIPLSLAGLAPTTSLGSRSSDTPNIYNVSLSHQFSRDLLAYVNTGTSYRPGFFSPGIQGVIATSPPDAALQALSNHPAERSRSYELGVKWTFLDGKARLNADIYRQRFSNFTMFVPNINYLTAPAGAPGSAQQNFAFTQPVDTLVQGFEVDAALQVTREWNVGLLASYADSKVESGQVVCNTFDAAGNPTFNHAGLISFCPGGSASRLPYWNATLTSEYDHPVADNMDGFVRGLFSFYPENKNRMEPNFTVPSYGLLNLFAGVRSQDGAWEVSLFAKNLLQNETVLDKSPTAANLNGLLIRGLGYAGAFPATSGYYATQVTPPREVGVNVRYAFGSR
jgi:iron complex outermembrane receptor protein